MPGRLERVDVDQRVVVQDLGVVVRDEPHAAHVRSEGVDLVDALRCLQAVLPTPEVEQQELVRVDIRVLGFLDIDASYPVAALPEVGHEMMADKAAGTRN